MPHLLKEVVTTSAHFHLMHHSVPRKDAAAVVYITVLMMLFLMHSIVLDWFCVTFLHVSCSLCGEKHIT